MSAKICTRHFRRLVSLFITLTFLISGAALAQKVKIKNIEGPKKFSCGGFLWKVKFELDAKAPNKGFIVQKLHWLIDIKNCDGTQKEKVDKTYWEAWSVDSGATTCKPAGPAGHNDQFSEPSHPNTTGTIKMEGKVAFFVMNNLPPSFKPGNPPEAGILLSDTLRPAFWTAAAEAGATSHVLTCIWDCCNGKDTTRLTTVPVFTIINVSSVNNPCIYTETTANLIARIPAWTKGYTAAEQATFDNVMTSLRQYSDNQILNGILCIVNNNKISGEDYLDNMSKIYIALRALYQVPGQLSASAASVFGGWIRPGSEASGTYSPLWPLQQVNGKLMVTGQYNGYLGFDYDAIGEFSYFSRHYPRAVVIVVDTDPAPTERKF